MLFAGKTPTGKHLYPKWFVFWFGGNYRQSGAGYGWKPSLLKLTKKYFREGWNKVGYSWWEFVQVEEL